MGRQGGLALGAREEVVAQGLDLFRDAVQELGPARPGQALPGPVGFGGEAEGAVDLGLRGFGVARLQGLARLRVDGLELVGSFAALGGADPLTAS